MELRNLPYAQQEQVMMYILTRVPALVGAAFDATGNGGYLAEAALLAFGPDIIDCVMLSPKWYGEWMPKLRPSLRIRISSSPAIRPRLMICAM